MATTVQISAPAPKLPALALRYSVAVLEFALDAYTGKLRELTPHTTIPFTNLSRRTKAAEHGTLNARFTVDPRAGRSGVAIYALWVAQDVAEPSSFDDVLDHPDCFSATVLGGGSATVGCPFDQFTGRGVAFDPDFGGRPTLFYGLRFVNENPFLTTPDGIVQPSPDLKEKYIRVNLTGELHISSLTNAMLA